jgi:two-component system sensor histidine kinase and response regulator WspE
MTNFDELSIQEIFQIEAGEHVANLKARVLELERGPADPATLDVVMRLAHTLKGAARIVGADAVQRVAHALEDLFLRLRLRHEPIRITPALASECLAALDVIERAIASAVEGQADDGVAEVTCQRLRRCLETLSADASDPGSGISHSESQIPETGVAVNVDSGISNVESEISDPAEPLPAPSAAEVVAQAMPGAASGLDGAALAESSVRVTVAQLDELMHLAGELHVSSTYFGQLRLREHLGETFQDFEVHLQQVVRRLHDHVLQIRMLRFGQLFRLFPRFIRDTAAELGKQVELRTKGEEVRVDRAVLQAVTDPLVQLIRNAIVHGVEAPGERARLGKPPAATLVLEASTRGDKVVVAVADDGRGIDVEAVRRRVIAQDRLSAEAVGRLSAEELVQFLFVPGFTTRDDATLTSGRGLGLDIVKTAVETIGGRVGVETAPGRGSRFELSIPLTLSVTRALVVRSGGQSVAFPMLAVDSIALAGPETVRAVGTRVALVRDDRLLPLGSLASLFGLEPGADAPAKHPTLLLGQGEFLCGVMAERFEGEMEIVVQPLDPRLGKVPLVSGAAILPDGSVALVADVVELVHAVHGRAGEMAVPVATEPGAGGVPALHEGRKTPAAPPRGTPAAATAPSRLGRVLIVEDSLTVREIERKILRESGYDVDVAVDGLDALARLRRDSRFDLLLVDVDMPRMNGLDLTRTLKADVKYQHIPIVIVSYKDREEDRRRGLEAGADRYIGKGQFENRQFLEVIKSLIVR